MDRYPDGLVCSFFEREGENIVAELQGNVLITLEEGEDELALLSDAVNLEQLLTKQIISNTKSEFAVRKNSSIIG
jgi:hypothetical protein